MNLERILVESKRGAHGRLNHVANDEHIATFADDAIDNFRGGGTRRKAIGHRYGYSRFRFRVPNRIQRTVEQRIHFGWLILFSLLGTILR